MDQAAFEEDNSECSRDSSSELTSSDTSSSVQEASRKQFESIKITTEIINLPKDLCEDKTVFNEFFSVDTWHCLSEPIRKHLGLFLPMFSENIEFEKNNTIESLFNNRITRFGSCPLEKLQQSLEEGNCRPEISTLKKSIAKAERREQRFQESERLSELARKVSVSRERTLRRVCQNPHSIDSLSKKCLYTLKSPLILPANALRAKKRYLQEINSVVEQLSLPDILSEDEQCSDVVLNYIPRKQRRLFGTIQGGEASPGADVRIVNTLGAKDEQTTTGYLIGPNGKISIVESHYRNMLVHHKRRKFVEPDHPELDCQDIKLKDVVVRTQASSGYRRIMPLPKVVNVVEESLAEDEENLSKCRNNTASTPTLPDSCSSSDLQKSTSKLSVHDIMKSGDVYNSDESIYLNYTANSSRATSEPEVYIKTIRLDAGIEVENCNSEIKELSVPDIGENNNSTQSVTLVDGCAEKNANVSSEIIDSFRSINESQIPDQIDIGTGDPVGRSTPNVEDIKISNKEEDSDTLLLVERPANHSKTKLDDQDQSNASRTLALNSIETTSYEKSMLELMQETHQCFLSLIRDMFCSTSDHRLTIDDLQTKLNVWLKTPIAALNDWYLHADDKWDDMLQSAILFLSGEFSDQPDDFVPYIEHKIQLNIYQWIGASRDSDHRLLDLCQYWLCRRHEMGIRIQSKPIKAANAKQKYASSNSSTTVEDDDGSSERTISPPPPRYPTDWSVRKATDEEVQLFRDQEKRRYENPHMAFTYKQHSYNSVVGPVKGIYTQVPGISKARGHNMLVADRPNFVTILTLVRDATARLPNGEGTRADICELLKSSQYISPTATDQVLQTIVSGALDRMHTEYDPCVKYDIKRKIWIYLHRSRTEEEFERLHHQYQGVAKHKKSVYRKCKSKEGAVANLNKAVSEPFIKSNSQSSLENDSVHSEPTLEIGTMSTNTIDSCNSLTSPTVLANPNLSTVVTSDKAVNSTSSSALVLSQKVAVTQRSSDEKNYMSEQPQSELLGKSPTGIELREKDSSKITVCASLTNVSQITKEPLPIRVSSTCKIQAVHMTNTQPQIIARATKQLQTSEINPSTNASKSLLTKKIITTTAPGIPLVISSTPSTVANFCNIAGGIPVQMSMAASVAETDRIGHSFIVPVTLSTESGGVRARLTPSTSQISISKPNRVQSVHQPTSVTMKATSLLQTKNPTPQLSQLPSTGSCMIQPESFVIATNRQQKIACISASASNAVATSPAAVLLKTDSRTSTPGVDIINTITIPKGQQSVLTPAQQKQILQNLLAQQNKQVFTSKSVIIGQSVTSNASQTCFVNSSNATTNSSGFPHVKGERQKFPTLTLSSSNTKGTSTVFQHFGSNVSNPHVIQIKSASNMLSGTSTTKIRPIITTLKEHPQAKQLQQSGISTSANVPQKNDIQEISVVKTSSNKNVLSEVTMASTTLVQSVVPGAQVTHMMKSATSVVHPSPNVIRTVNVTQGSPHVMAKVVKKFGENQFVSLDSLLPRQQLGDAAIKLTEPKAMKTQLFHLSSSGPAGSQIAQYAVVPQNRNIISVSHSSGHSTTPTIITTTASRVTDPKTIQTLVTSHSTVTSVSHTPVTSIAHRNGVENSTGLIQSNHLSQAQLQQQTVPQVVTKLPGISKLLSTKVRNGNSFIDSSSINFAAIGGNPLIIASKPAIRSETLQHNATGSVFQNSPVSTESTNIVYGRQAVKVQGNIVSQSHVSIVNAQQGRNTTTQKLLLSNQLVKVRSVPRQPQKMQISFAQQSGVNTGLGSTSGISVVKAQAITGDQLDKSTLSNVSQKPLVGTPIKAAQKVGIRLNQPTQRVVLATQGGQLVTQQIIVPQGFQGGAFNIKRLKVIPVNSQQKGSMLRPQVVTTQQKTTSSTITDTTVAVSDAKIESNNKLYHVFNSTGSCSSNLNNSVE